MIHTQRKAFSMLTAIVVIVTMAVIASYVMSTAGKTIKITTDQYRKEQAMFLAKSYTEYAIMAVSANVARINDTGCLTQINAIVGTQGVNADSGRGTGYSVRIRIAYIGNNRPGVAGGSGINNCAITSRWSTAVANPATPLSIIVDAYVDYNDLNDQRIDNQAISLTYHRRSLQKI